MRQEENMSVPFPTRRAGNDQRIHHALIVRISSLRIVPEIDGPKIDARI
jgi:hypothetical protein